MFDSNESPSEYLKRVFNDSPNELQNLGQELGIKNVMLYPTNECPLGCEHCYINSLPLLQNTRLSRDAMLRVINSGIAQEDIVISGGEVSLHPDIEEVILFASEKARNVTVFTTMLKWAGLNSLSGIIEPTERIEKIQQNLIKMLSKFPENVDFRFGIDIYHLSKDTTISNFYIEIVKALLILPKEKIRCKVAPQLKVTIDRERDIEVLSKILQMDRSTLESLGLCNHSGYISSIGRATEISKAKLKPSGQIFGSKLDTLYVGNLNPVKPFKFSIAFIENYLIAGTPNLVERLGDTFRMPYLEESIRKVHKLNKMELEG